VLGAEALVAFVPASDLEQSRAFYGGVLGLRLIEASDIANVFDAGGTALRVTRVDAPARAGYTVLGWRVADLAAAIAGLAARGVVFKRYPNLRQDDLGVWTAPSTSRIAWFEDPDGNVLSLEQPSAEA
jgi:catechol 2,3-dioxygenase-like lactoylglutathione lyase family enzyme